jgi:hypothetical protein
MLNIAADRLTVAGTLRGESRWDRVRIVVATRRWQNIRVRQNGGGGSLSGSLLSEITDRPAREGYLDGCPLSMRYRATHLS